MYEEPPNEYGDKKNKPDPLASSHFLVREPAATYVRLTREGLRREQLDRLRELSQFDLETLAKLLGITPRTIQRKTTNETFRPETTERLLELLHLYAIGEFTFGSLPPFRAWLLAPIPALGNETPLSYLDTGFGIRMIVAELERINYGVFS